jgi:hypothetical protein
MVYHLSLLLPPRYSRRDAQYDVRIDGIDGEIVVRDFVTSFFDAARALLSRRVTIGRVERWDAERPRQRITGDIETLAAQTVIETGRERPRLARWKPFPAERQCPKTADSPSGLLHPSLTETAAGELIGCRREQCDA